MVPRIVSRIPRSVRLLALLAAGIVLFVYTFSGSISNVDNSLAGLGSEKLSLEDRCEIYFGHLADSKTDWSTNFHTKSKSNIRQAVQRMRLYGHCYLRNKFVPKSFKLSQIEFKLFNVFNTRQLSAENYEGRESPSMFSSYGKGRGIVISFGSHQLHDFKRLLVTLSLVGNVLPIQVVYKGDLRPSDIHTVLAVADSLTPPQVVSFVDVENRISPEHFPKFSRFANKWLAAIFNSFEEVILVDADVVSFVNPETLFELEGYKKTGSYFFRDRAISDEFLSSSAMNLYKSLLPSKLEESLFGLPGSEKPRLSAMDGHRHIMESGVVVFNRRKYLPGILIGFSLQLWELTASPVWGDKELFWIGQSVASEEEYYLAPRFAGTIGQLKTLDGKEFSSAIERREAESSMICSSHPAHFDEHHKLLWVNSGLSNCKLETWGIDYKKFNLLKEKFRNDIEAREYYRDVIEVDSALIPNYVDYNMIKNNKQIGFQKNDNYGCSGYIWCAFDTPEAPATKIVFTKKELDHIDRIKSAWYLVFD